MSESSLIGAIMLDLTRPLRCYRLNIFPYRAHTVAMLTCTDWHGRTESDRRVNTWDLRIPAEELRVTDEREALLYVLRELVDVMDPPPGAPWAEPSAPPGGGHGGEQLTLFEHGNWA